MKRKIWTTLIGASLATAAVDASAMETVRGTYPNGTLEHALDKMFDGEGGESGIGMSDLKNGAITVPSLRGAQITRTVSGNTVRSGNRFAAYFAPDGKMQGWILKWSPAAAESCASLPNPGFARGEDGACIKSRELAVEGAWKVEGDKLCAPGIFDSPFEPDVAPKRCYSLALVINNILAFDKSGKLARRPLELAKGDNRAKLTR